MKKFLLAISVVALSFVGTLYFGMQVASAQEVGPLSKDKLRPVAGRLMSTGMGPRYSMMGGWFDAIVRYQYEHQLQGKWLLVALSVSSSNNVDGPVPSQPGNLDMTPYDTQGDCVKGLTQAVKSNRLPHLAIGWVCQPPYNAMPPYDVYLPN
jgi:hypothetical protein